MAEDHSYQMSGEEESSKNAHAQSCFALGSLRDVPPLTDRSNTCIKEEKLINARLKFELKAPSELEHDVVDNKQVFSDPTPNVGPGFQDWSIKPEELWNVVCNSSCAIQIKPMLLIVTGLPKCGKSKHLINALQRAVSSKYEAMKSFSSLEPTQQGNIQYTELSAIVSSLDQEPIYFETSKKTTYMYAIERALKFEYFQQLRHICDYVKLEHGDTICEEDSKLNEHFRKCIDALKASIDNPQKLQHEWQRKIHTGLTLINIWDMGVNKAAFHFLPALWGRLERSFMWLFFKVDHDRYNLSKRPERSSVNCSENDSSKHVMPYRSRHRYLFREAMLAQTKKDKPRGPNCSIFGIRKNQEINDTSLDSIIDGAIPMGVDSIIEPKVIPLEEGKISAYHTLKCKMDEMVFRAQERKETMPLSYIFLRSVYYDLDEMFVKKKDLEKKAMLLKISEIKRFFELFSSSGSIIDIDLDFVIMKPMGFIQKLDDLFCPRDEIDSVGQLKEYGLLTTKTAEAIFGEDYSFFLEVLTTVNLALKIEKGETIYIDSMITNEDNLDNTKPKTFNEVVYYIPDVRDVLPDLENHEHSLLLRMSINSSLCHMQVLFAKEYLAKNKNCKLHLKKSCHVNVTKFQTGTDELLCLQYLGEVIEFRYTIGHTTENAARTIIDACCKIMDNDHQQLPATSYNFAIKCSKFGEFKGADRIAQPHHIVVPYGKFSLEKCKRAADKTKDERCKCTAMENDWNNVLKEMADVENKNKIPEERLLELKPISDFDISNVATALHSLSDVTKDKFIEQLKKDVLSETGKPLKVSMEYSERITYLYLFEWEKHLSKLGIKCSSTDLAILLMKLAKDTELAKDQKTTLQNLARKLDILVDVIPLDSESQS